MKLERYNSNGRFHEAVIHNGVLYLSGQISDKGETVSEQALSCLEILEGKLEKY
ncbi:RidA family protein, partial [Neglecta sp. X4]|nr:RidA family protein [Neglectibacter sp. X4]